MKMITGNNQITLRDSGIGQLIFGLLFAIIGLFVTFGYLTASNKQIAFLIVGLAFLAVGALMALLAKHYEASLVRDGNVTITQKRLLFGTPKVESAPASNVTAVKLITGIQNSVDSDGRNSSSQVNTLYLTLNNGTQVALASKSGSSVSVGGINLSAFRAAPLSKEGEAVANLLGLQLQVSDNNGSLAGAVSAIKSIFQGNNNTQINNLTNSQTTTTTPPPAPVQPVTPAQPLPTMPPTSTPTPITPLNNNPPTPPTPTV